MPRSLLRGQLGAATWCRCSGLKSINQPIRALLYLKPGFVLPHTLGIKMADDNRLPPPSIMWAQREDKVFVTINLEDCKSPTINLEESKLVFKGKGGPDQKEYEVTVEFFKEIDPPESKYVVFQRNIPMVLKKKEPGPYWPRLLKDAKKQHWLKTDFNKWRDEDDSDQEGGDDMQLEDMMKQMGNFNPGAGGEPLDEEEDSDDEDLPDLE